MPRSWSKRFVRPCSGFTGPQSAPLISIGSAIFLIYLATMRLRRRRRRRGRMRPPVTAKCQTSARVRASGLGITVGGTLRVM